MTGQAEPSLRIAFDVTRTRAVLRVQEGRQSDLAQLAARFPGGGQRGPLSAEIELEAFLVGLGELGTWPSPEDVEWDDELAQLVGGVLDDADAAQQQLEGADDGTHQTITHEEIPALLGAEWAAPLTDFQQRDISRLLSLRHGANFSVPGAGEDPGRARGLRRDEGARRSPQAACREP